MWNDTSEALFCENFDELSSELKATLIAFINQTEIDDDDKEQLFELAESHELQYCSCPECKELSIKASGERTDNFSGHNANDYTSYPPASNGRFTQDYAEHLCDACRCHIQYVTPSGETYSSDV